MENGTVFFHDNRKTPLPDPGGIPQTSYAVDLHVHSRFSTTPSQWILQKIGCAESYTDPLDLYAVAKARGMHHVTITDHDSLEGALEIAHLPDTFVSEEISARFPEDGCEVHVLAWNITEKQHSDIRRARENLYELVGIWTGRISPMPAPMPFATWMEN